MAQNATPNTPDTFAADQAAFTNLYNQGAAWKSGFQWNNDDTFSQRIYQDPGNSKLRYREINNHAQMGDHAQNDFLIREDQDASGKWVATRAYSVAQDGKLQPLHQENGKWLTQNNVELKGNDQTYIAALQVNPAAAIPVAQAPAAASHAAPAVAALSTTALAGLQTTMGLTGGDAKGQWTNASQAKLQKLFATAQADSSYTGKPDLLYGPKTQAALDHIRSSLTPDQQKMADALKGMNGGNATLTGQQLAASGYVRPSAQTVTEEIAAAQQKSDPIGNALAQAKNPGAAPKPLSPADMTALGGSQDAALPAFGNKPNYKVIPSGLASNPAYQAAMGETPNVKAKVTHENGMTITEVKGPGGLDSIYGSGTDGTQIATTTKHGSVTSKIVIDGNQDDQVASDQEMQKNAKGKTQLAQMVTMPNPAAQSPTPGAQPTGGKELANNGGGQQKPSSRPGPMLKV